MKRAATILAFLALGCAPETTTTPDLSYCGNNDGDAFCAEADPAAPFCVGVSDACLDASGIDITHPNGCVSEMPAQECREACGVGNGDACLDPTAGEASSTSSGGETESSSTTKEPETDTEEPSTTTGPECSEDMPCMDAGSPFCVDGTCSTCNASVDPAPDEACAMLDETAPLCVEAECVQCTEDETSACGGTTPLCDVPSNTCAGCSFHEECQDLGLPACNIATGACFDAANVTMVSGASNGAIATAVANVADGAEHAIVLTGGGGNHTVTVDGGKTIAIVSSTTTVHSVRGNNGSPVITVTGAGTTAYLHRLRVEDTDDVGVSVASGATLYADAAQVAGNDGGGIELAAGTSGFLRNCMVAGFAGNASAISSSGTLSVVYSTLGRDTNFGDPVLECSGGSTTVRNSIIVSQTNAPGTEVDCPGISIENSAQRASQTPADWFGTGFASGNYSLNAAGQTEFDDIAIWEDGDPPFDFDGDARPNTDGADDYAGADTIP